MKNLIISLGINLFANFLMIFQMDYNKNIKYSLFLKDMADDSTAAASLFIDLEKFAEGYKIYDYENGMKVIDELLDYNMKDMEYNYIISFSDQSGFTKTFRKGG